MTHPNRLRSPGSAERPAADHDQPPYVEKPSRATLAAGRSLTVTDPSVRPGVVPGPLRSVMVGANGACTTEVTWLLRALTSPRYTDIGWCSCIECGWFSCDTGVCEVPPAAEPAPGCHRPTGSSCAESHPRPPASSCRLENRCRGRIVDGDYPDRVTSHQFDRGGSGKSGRIVVSVRAAVA